MPKREDIQHSILIVSASEQFEAIARKSLKNALSIHTKKSGAMARRCILEGYYDLVIINAPLPDESGEEFALDAAEKSGASVLIVAPREVYEDVSEHVTDQGILVIAKPFPRGHMDKAIRYLTAVQNRIHQLEKKVLTAQERMDELRVVGRAKILLVQKKHMTEDEAHRFIGKQAMNNGVSRRRIAEMIAEDLE